MLCPKTWPNWRGMPRDGIKELLKVPSRNPFDVINMYWLVR